MSNAPYTLMLLVLGSVQITGCIGLGSGSESPAFSPDGTHISYLSEDRLEEWVVDGKTWFRSINLHWCSVSDPAKESSIPVETLVGAEFMSSGRVPCLEVKWSPNSSRIGVLTPHKLIIVEANSRKKTEIRDGRIMSFAWLSSGEIAYCTRRTRGNMQRRVICRQDLTGQHRTEVAAFREYPGRDLQMDYSWREYWSPSGKHVIFLEPAFGGQYHCVNVFDGTTHAFGQTKAKACHEGVAWAPDSSHAFCVSRKVGPEDIYEAILLEPATGKAVDRTSDFQETFKGGWPTLEPIWTADGKYVLANGSPTGGLLVQPDPWKVVPLGQILAPKFDAGKKSTNRLRLFRLPVAGWVGVLFTEKEGDPSLKYAADYSGEQVRALQETPDDLAISPDGTLAATIGQDKRVRILNLDKWDKGTSLINANH